MFRLVFGLDLTGGDKDHATDLYDDDSLQGAYSELAGSLSSFSPTDQSTLTDFVEAAQKLRDFIKS